MIREPSAFANRVWALWKSGLNTADIAKRLAVKEHNVERQLHLALNNRRSILASLGRRSDAS